MKITHNLKSLCLCQEFNSEVFTVPLSDTDQTHRASNNLEIIYSTFNTGITKPLTRTRQITGADMKYLQYTYKRGKLRCRNVLVYYYLYSQIISDRLHKNC